MKIRYLLCTLALAIAPGLIAQPPAGGREPQTELGAKMEKMGSAFRALRRQIADATKNEDSLAKLAVIKENATAALKLDPALKAKKPEAEQAKFVADYQAGIKNLLADIATLETALKAGDNAAAAKAADAMNKDQTDGHKAFRPPQARRGGPPPGAPAPGGN